MKPALPQIPKGRCPQKKILILAPGNNPHIVKWVNGLQSRKMSVGLVSLHGYDPGIQKDVLAIKPPYSAPWGYLANRTWLKKKIKDFQPDLIHAHYGTGYGHLGAGTSGTAKILSVWGSEIYKFAHRSPLHRRFLQKNLRAYDWICSTSWDMAQRTLDIEPLNHKLSVTPFGVDLEMFASFQRKPKTENLIIGSTKSLARAYGLDVLIEGFSLAQKTIPTLRLLLFGDGPRAIALRALAQKLAVSDSVDFRGAIPPEKIPQALAEMDIYVAPSRWESFGVAVLEASAAGLPVIATNVGGLPEVVEDGVTGLLIPSEDATALAEKLVLLAKDHKLRNDMGHSGRSFVSENYLWQDSLDIMESLYAHLLKGETPGRQ